MSVSEVNSCCPMSLEELSFDMRKLNVLGLAVWPATNRPPYCPSSSVAMVMVSAGSGSLSTYFAPPVAPPRSRRGRAPAPLLAQDLALCRAHADVVGKPSVRIPEQQAALLEQCPAHHPLRDAGELPALEHQLVPGGGGEARRCRAG